MSDKEDRTFQLECIEVYNSLPALRKVKSNDYSNRPKKGAAYAALVEKFKEKYPENLLEMIHEIVWTQNAL